ncbi:efflux RND transporter periplasmic adaptor subunit [soil metagenome]
MPNEPRHPQPLPGDRRKIPIVIGVFVVALLGIGALMVRRAESQTNKIALAGEAKPVTFVEAKASPFRGSRIYVGTLQPWLEAKIGPQLVSAYVDTVLVRPGAEVKKGDVLATLDCRNASATSQAVSMQARALEARQQALSHESARLQGLLDAGFVSPNEAEQKSAQSASEQAQVLATQAKLLGTSLEVNDCVLRAPFSGEVATRTIDPGAFVRPGASIVSVVDRTAVRVVGDAPEVDFDVVAPRRKVRIRVLATGTEVVATISRRAPSADPGTRTVRFELDVPNPDRSIPVGTTGEIHIEVGEPVPASEIPLYAASVRGAKASVFVIDGNVAHSRVFAVRGETSGRLFLDPELAPGSHVVTEGRALLKDGDPVSAAMEKTAPAAPATPPTAEKHTSEKGTSP